MATAAFKICDPMAWGDEPTTAAMVQRARREDFQATRVPRAIDDITEYWGLTDEACDLREKLKVLRKEAVEMHAGVTERLALMFEASGDPRPFERLVEATSVVPTVDDVLAQAFAADASDRPVRVPYGMGGRA